MHYLEKFQSVISLWDESSSFMSSFGRYSGTSSAGYDRSIYLELSNASEEFRRDLKNARCVIDDPRLSIGLLGKICAS